MERFADIEVLRYEVPDFDSLTLRQKKLIYFLTEAALEGRDILFDQNGRYNLRVRFHIRELQRQPFG
jgi:dipeptidyl-peptidase-3